ncbi:MAG: nucleoid-associated protein, partial [Selenomonadaceae bacterium]|nr:nucleoid-associated protein [Selenomonadaceae bacterium]
VLPELLLECAQSPSPNETIKEISKAVKKVTEAYCQDQVEAAAAVKSYIAENLQPDGQLDPQEVGMAVFKDNPSMQADYRQEMENSGFGEPVVVNQEATLKKMRKHRLSTDTGIELVIPTEFFENTEFVEFYKDDDGFMSITLKNIQNITNK